jgi:hypothetical protein
VTTNLVADPEAPHTSGNLSTYRTTTLRAWSGTPPLAAGTHLPPGLSFTGRTTINS